MSIFKYLSILLLTAFALLSINDNASAQLGNRPGLQGSTGVEQRDPFSNDPTQNTVDSNSAAKKKSNWDEEAAVLYYKYLNSDVLHYYDTSIAFLHRNQYTQPNWYQDLGNWGTVAKQNLFTPNFKTGLKLGFDNWDVYKYTIDSIHFINTTRPYTSFSYMMGSKQLQWVDFLHTQNINPRWNFALKVSNNVSDGYFALQKANGFNAYLSSNYKSENERHTTKFAFIMNNFKQDENGGIINEGDLTNNSFSNREIIDVNVTSNSVTNSPVYNRQNDLQLYIENSYAWGKKDSLYNEDSTKVSYKFTPRFSIKNILDIQNSRHKYRDALPMTKYYEFYDSINFVGLDTVFSRPKHFLIDNRFSLNSFIGKDSNQILIEAGLGIRYDRLATQYESQNSFTTAAENSLNNYVYGQIRKDALKNNQWSYLGELKFYYTGKAIGNTDAKVSLSKSFPKLGSFTLGLNQTIASPTYQQEFFKSSVFEITNNFANTSNTKLYGSLWVKALKLQLSLSNQLINNYIYLDSNLKFQQHNTVFSVLQFSGRKMFQFGAFSLDNEVVWQQLAGEAPVNFPNILLRHQLAYKLPLFKGKLDANIGIEGRYNTAHTIDGYSQVFNQFYYQNRVKANNYPSMSAFFNFKVKRLRAFVMGDQLQQMIWPKNNMAAVNYYTQNAYFRFGFNWIMMN